MNMRARVEAWLRQAFRWLNKYMILHWRLGLGPVGNRAELTGCIMVLIHRGRKSGLRRRTPVNYAIVDGAIYCVAGFGPIADWYRNVMADPAVEVWLPNGWYAGTARDVTDLSAAEKAPIVRQVLINSGFAGRLAGINAREMSEQALLDATATYRVVRIDCTEARTGPGGPGDLAWIWPLTTMALAAWVFLQRRRPA